jgi:hypothetical protein
VKKTIIKKFQKVFLVFEIGQKKMSKIENPKKVLKKTLANRECDDNALIFIFWLEKSVTIKFLQFFSKQFRHFYKVNI